VSLKLASFTNYREQLRNFVYEQTNTYQAVLITDGYYSFVMMNYGTLTWTTGVLSGGNKTTGRGGTAAVVSTGCFKKSSCPKTFWNISTSVKSFCVKFCEFVGNSYPHNIHHFL